MITTCLLQDFSVIIDFDHNCENQISQIHTLAPMDFDIESLEAGMWKIESIGVDLVSST